MSAASPSWARSDKGAGVAQETLTANGVDLADLALSTVQLSGLLTAPGKRTDNVAVANRHGAVKTPRKRYEVNHIALPLWVHGCNPDGSIPTSQNAEFYQNVDRLLRLFAQHTIVLDHGLPDGSHRVLEVEVLDVLDFTRRKAGPLGKVGVTLTAADPFWRDTSNSSGTVNSDGPAVTTTLAAFAGATAPSEELVLELPGPANNPKLASGDYFVTYEETIPDGQQVTIDTGAWTVTTSAGLATDYSKLKHAGIGHWFALQPTTGGPTVTYEHSGTGLSIATITGRRRYLGG